MRKFLLHPFITFHLLVALVCLGLGACGGNISNKRYHEGTGSLEGVLLLPEGKPAQFAQVEVVNIPSLTTKTNQKGQFSIKDIPAGRRELLIKHNNDYGLRVEIWIVRDRVLELEKALGELKPTGSIVGRVESKPRFGNKGILVMIKGTSIQSKTSNHEGDFVLKNVPTGCHILQVTTPFFAKEERAKVCVSTGETLRLSEVITLTPNTRCQPQEVCPQNSLCLQNHCVPDGGGEAKLLQLHKTFDSLFIQESRIVQHQLLKNVGPGRLLIKKIRLQSPSEEIFTLKTKENFYVKSGDTLSLPITIHGNKPGLKEATLFIETNDPDQPILKTSIKAEIRTYKTQCLLTTPSSLSLGKLTLGTEKKIQIKLFNRCGKSIFINKLDKNFPEPVLVTLLQKLPVIVDSGQEVQLTFQILPQAYGLFKGELLLHNNPNNGSLRIPIEGEVPGSLVKITPQPLDFGSVPPGETRMLWLALQLSAPPSSLRSLQFSVLSKTQGIFRAHPTLLARSPSSQKLYYLPIQFTAPTTGSLQMAWLTVKNIPGLGQLPYIVQLRGSVATGQTPYLPPNIHVGNTDQCTSKDKTIYLSNPGSQAITIKKITTRSMTPSDFSLVQGKLPIKVEANSTKEIGKVRFNGTKDPIRAFARLELELTQGGVPMAPVVVGLQAASRLSHNDFFHQPKQKSFQILVYGTHSFLQDKYKMAEAKGIITELLKKLKDTKTDFRVSFLHHERVSDITPQNKNPEQMAIQYLERYQDSSYQGLNLMKNVLKKSYHDLPTMVLYFATKDDRSAYHPSHYNSSAQKKEPNVMFSAIPARNCGALKTAGRVLELTKMMGGHTLDLCRANKTAWKNWKERILRFATSERKTFTLSQKPSTSNIDVQVGQKPLTSKQWKYNQEDNTITLQSSTLLPRGEKLTISYFTPCK